MVEKIKRDVRITTIYEGTSEIMEMTIARDRWQEHLKTRGRYYHDRARRPGGARATATRASAPDVAALALHALAEVLERCRTGRLTRHQHVLLRLGELIAYAEGAEALSRRAARGRRRRAEPEGRPPVRRRRRWRRSPASSPATPRSEWRWGGLRLVRGAGGAEDADLAELEAALAARTTIAAAQAGVLADMDAAADAIYGRIERSA